MTFRGSMEALILGALQDGPCHGYAIAKAIESKGEGLLKLGENQLYPILHRLEREGHVTSEWRPQENKPPRKVYALTDSGRTELDRYRSQWGAFSKGVGSLLFGKTEANHG